MCKILVTSDLHGRMPDIKEEFDILLICGDICPPHDHYFSFQKQWIENEFVEWINGLPFKDEWSRVVMTWGNHDFIGERFHKNEENHLSKLTNNRLVILKNAYYEHEILTDNGLEIVSIFGTPYCKVFGNWAFMLGNEKLEEKYARCPYETDIVITHDSPTMNGLGRISEGFQSGVDAGNLELDHMILSKNPKYVFSGHIHSGNHKLEQVGNTYLANVSYINERYNPAYPILKLEIDDDTKELKNSEYIEVETKTIY